MVLPTQEFSDRLQTLKVAITLWHIFALKRIVNFIADGVTFSWLQPFPNSLEVPLQAPFFAVAEIAFKQVRELLAYEL